MTNVDGNITLDVREYMACGLDVYDVAASQVGKVANLEAVSGYMMVRTNPFAERDLVVPFSAITHIDPRDLFVSKTKDEVEREYCDPPPRSVVVQVRMDRDTGEDDSRTLIRVPSGYDGSPITVGHANIGKLAHNITAGFEVYTSDLEFLGRVKWFSRKTKQLQLVGPGDLSNLDMPIPLAVVETVDRYKSAIYLAVSLADLKRMQGESASTIVTVEDGERR